MGFAAGMVSGVLVGGGINALGGIAGGWYGSKSKEREQIIFATHLGALIAGLGIVGFLRDDSSLLSGIKIATIVTTIFSTSLRLDSDKAAKSYLSALKVDRAEVQEGMRRTLWAGMIALSIGSIVYGCTRSLRFAELTSFFWGNVAAFFWDKRIELEGQEIFSKEERTNKRL